VPLDDLVELRTEKIAGTKDPSLPYIGLEHIAQGEPRLLGMLPSNASVSVNNQFVENDILFGKLRPNLRKSVRAPFPGYCSTDILVLRARSGVRPEFAGHVFQWERVFAGASATAEGTKMPRTSWTELKRLPVFRPSTEAEQSRIAIVLNAVDEAIGHDEAVIAKLRQVRAGLLHDLLTCGINKHGQLRDPESEPFEDTILGRIPRGWRVCGVLDVAPADRQAILTGPFGAQLGQDDFVSQGVPVLRIGNVQAGYIDWTDTQFVTRAKAAQLKRFSVVQGDLLFARQGATTGRNALADQRSDGALINYHIIRVATDRNQCEPKFLHAIFNSELALRQINRDKGRGTREGINTEQIASLRFALPPIDEQRLAVGVLSSLDEAASALEGDLVKLRQLRCGLMTDLLTGRVRVPEALGAQS